MQLDSVQIGVTEIDAACAAYRVLLGVEPVALRDGVRRFQLERGAVEIEGGPAGVHSIRFHLEAGDVVLPNDTAALHGLRVLGGVAPETPLVPRAVPDAVAAIDHVVVQTPDADRAIQLWRDRLGVRLALDRVFAERGLRLLFFRSGGITLEFASPYPPPSGAGGPDQFYGVSYRVTDLVSYRARLLAAGVDVSPIRPGMRPGTSVATVRSDTAGVPTLVVQIETPPQA